MCLEKARLIEEQKDITCYKICRRRETLLDGEEYYVSLFMGYIYELGKLVTNEGRYAHVYPEEDGLLITSNAFHSFKTLKAAQNVKKKLPQNYVIVKCTIPKESTFVYEGVCFIYGKTYVSYASQQLLPISVVES